MIELEFQPQAGASGSEVPEIILHMRAGLVASTCFIHPVRFHVDGVELFAEGSTTREVFICRTEEALYGQADQRLPGGAWRPLPILYLATTGFEKARLAIQGEAAICNFPGGGSIQFLPGPGKIEVYTSFHSRPVRANRAELLGAFADFNDRVRRFLLAELPALRDHPGWTAWFGEGS